MKVFQIIMEEVIVGRNSMGCRVQEIHDRVIATRTSDELKPEQIRGLRVGQSRYTKSNVGEQVQIKRIA